MKVLIQHDGGMHAHYFERLGLARALEYSGHNVSFWNNDAISAFDMFDNLEPDIFIGQTYNITDSIIQTVKERPKLLVYMKAGDFGEAVKEYDLTKYEILVASEDEKNKVRKMHEETGRPNFVGCHYIPDRIESSHGYWMNFGPKPLSMMLGADIFDHTNSEPSEEFASDISFVGGYWGYKGQNIQKYFIPLCGPNQPYNIKIFGGSPWPVHQYCGNLDPSYTKIIHKSAKVCVNVSEPHAILGFEYCERPFKLLSNKCLCISDWNDDLATKIFNNDGMIWTKNPKEFKQMIDHYLKYPHEKSPIVERGYNKCINEHTYFHRASYLLKAFGLHQDSDNILKSFEKVKIERNL